MRLPYLLLSIFIIINLLVDWYIYRVCLKRQRKQFWSKLQLYSAGAMILVAITIMSLPFRSGNNAILAANMWLLFTYLSVYFCKYLFLSIDLIARTPQLFRKNRWKWMSVCGIALSAISFAAMWWGALFNRYNINVKDVEIEIANLPDKFNGYRILQFSDLHVGTYINDTTFVNKVVNTINEINPDLVAFTGDIVNREASELQPFTSPLSHIAAKDGVIAILGNHDYGDYKEWDSPTDKAADRQSLINQFNKMGWKLLLNETQSIKRGNDSIAIIGVENIGDPPFKIYGNLSKAYPNADDSTTKILLSHNPSHWVDSIAGSKDRNIALTLSGHTHAMQFSILGWSPSAWRYKTWGGLYDDEHGHRLYVNIGIGTVGFPARIGATPELTIFTLRKTNRLNP